MITQATEEDEKAFEMLTVNYASCMNGAAINETGGEGIPALISRVVELFPLEDADYTSDDPMTEEDYENLAQTLIFLNNVGVRAFGDFSSFPDNQNPVRFH